jgi:hypothetical protein
MNKLLFLLNLLALSFTVEAHVNSKTASGANVSWQGTTALSLYLDITNLTTDLSYSQIYNSVLTSTSQYSTNTPMQINLSTYPGDRVGQNTVTFTSQPYFSSGIIAVTQVNYNASTGQISEADIIVNDLYTFTATSGSNYYLSDVITHELGHFLGLSHSEIKDSSMIYTSFNGQATLAQDDINGIKSKYAPGGSTIKGKVVGGSSLIGVFGAHVQAISTQTGKVAGAVISNSDGSFSISNLSSLDSYFIYVSPLKHLDSIPSFYSSINNQICSGSSYRGSYYTKCGDDYKDAPQPVYVSTTSTTNIGKISVRCSFSASLDYLDQKNATSRDARELNTYGQNFTGAVSGIFYSFEKLGPSDTTYGDDFEIDLSSMSSPSGKYLDLKFLSQDLFSKLAVSIYVTRGDGATYNYIYSSSSPQLDTDGNEELARRLSIPLSSTAADNIFDVRLVPISESNMNSTNSLFPSYTILGDSLSHYLLISSISNGITIETFPQTTSISDNSYCAENANVYQVAGFSTAKDQSASASSLNVKQASAPLSCGTIDIDNQDPPTGGPMSFCLGFFALILLSRMKKRFIS